MLSSLIAVSPLALFSELDCSVVISTTDDEKSTP